jgi:hypothetical protein
VKTVAADGLTEENVDFVVEIVVGVQDNMTVGKGDVELVLLLLM